MNVASAASLNKQRSRPAARHSGGAYPIWMDVAQANIQSGHGSYPKTTKVQ